MGMQLKIYSSLVFCILLIACRTETSWEKWTENHIRPLSSLDEQNYEDLYFLDNLLVGKTFVILGEETHGEKATVEYKLRLIRYLNQKLGYKILLAEGLNFYTYTNDSSLIKENASLQYLRSDVFSSIYKSLSDSFLLFGIDTNQSLYTQSFIDSLRQFVLQIENDNFSIDWEKMNQANRVLYELRNTAIYSESELYQRLRKADSLIINLQSVENFLSTILASNTDIFLSKLWMQKIKNRICELKDYQLTAENRFLHKKFTLDSLSRKAIALRDRQMAENIRWIKSVYPDDKFIVWTATVHGLKSYNVLEEPHRTRFNYRKSLRSYLDDWFPGQTYTIAFNDYEGSIDDGKQLKGTLPIPSVESLESVMNRYYPFSFIDFSSCRDSLLIKRNFKANLMGGEKEGAWMQAVDGVLFIRKQTPLLNIKNKRVDQLIR